MSPDTSPLLCAITEDFSEGAPFASLRLTGRENRVRIEVVKAYKREGVLGFALALGYRLSFARLGKLADVRSAFVLSIEHPDARAVGAVRLLSPGAVPPPVPNCTGAPPRDDSSGAFVGDQFGMWIEAGIGEASPDARVYLRATIHDVVSNTVSIGLGSLDVLQH